MPERPERHALDWRNLHVWQIQPVRDLLGLLAIFGVLYLGYRLSIVTVPILLALLLAYLFEPVVRRATHTQVISRQGAAIGIIVLSGLSIVLPVSIGVVVGVAQAGALAQEQSRNVQALVRSINTPDSTEFRERLPNKTWKNIRDWLVEQQKAVQAAKPEPSADNPPAPAPDNPPPATERLEQPAESTKAEPKPSPPEPDLIATAANEIIKYLNENSAEIGKRALRAGGSFIQWMVSAAGSLGAVLFGAFLTAFFFYFFCTGYGKVLSFWEGLIPERKKGVVIELIQKMDRVIAGFVRGRLTICGCQIVLFTLGYWALGVPAPFILGPIVGILTLAPYAASLGIPIAMLLMALDPPDGWRGQWWWIVAAPILMQVASQVTDDYVLTPRIQGKSTDMSVPLILFSSIAGGVMAGFYGLLLAIPVAACVKILLNEVFWPRFKKWAEGKEQDFLPI